MTWIEQQNFAWSDICENEFKNSRLGWSSKFTCRRNELRPIYFEINIFPSKNNNK